MTGCGVIDCEIIFARKRKVVKMFPNLITDRSYGLMKTYRKELWFNTPHRRDFINITGEVEQPPA
jgi:hypothetical protein